MILYAPGMRHLGMALVAIGALLGAGGLFVFFTERGVANEIKGSCRPREKRRSRCAPSG